VKLPPKGSWVEAFGEHGDVVVSSRARLARNLADFPFVNRADAVQQAEVLRLVRSLPLCDHDDWQWIELGGLDRHERRLLLERHLVSQEFIDHDLPRAVGIGHGDRLSVMVNEEDHLRMQALVPGCDLPEAWRLVAAIDGRLEQVADLAVHPRWGYLTACPTNIGTAVRFSVMAHLPALRLTNEVERLKRAAIALDVAVRGFYGEGSDSSGEFYQLSNQVTLGMSEVDLLERFSNEIVPRIVAYERMAREMLLDRNRLGLEDKVQRSLGLLRSARLLTAEEAMKNLSRLRLGVVVGLLEEIELATIHRLFLDVQPAHLRREHPDLIPDSGSTGRDGEDERTRARRAAIVRSALA
jgi:protein arginine kinase